MYQRISFFVFIIVLLSTPFQVIAQQKNKDNNHVKPSQYTLQVNQAYLKQLPFDDTTAFEDAKRGLIAPLANEGVLKDDSGRVVWNAKAYDFLQKMDKPQKTVNPSLWRQAKLLYISGLFKVTDHIYQVRGLDLSNITIIEGKKGIIVVDPLTTVETAKAAMSLYYKKRGHKKVLAVIYSHSHIDHYGGAGALINNDNKNNIKIIAPEGFYQHAISENLLAGAIMSHRASYMYGALLPKGPTGQVSTGLGMTTPHGTTSLIRPNTIISKNNQKLTIDGVDFVFRMAPDSEAPSEMFFYMPQYKALFPAEDATHTMHNIYTLRGAKVRNPLLWSKYLNEALHEWGGTAEVLFAPHHWPIWGSKNIQKHLSMQRDLYRYINDQTLRLANLGYDMSEIAERLHLPKNLAQYWPNRGYYGALSVNVKGTYVNYLGWFSGNPAELNPLPTKQASQKYIEYMGGEDNIVKKAQKDYDNNNYRWVAEVLNKVVIVNPDNQKAKHLLADTYDQLAYQSENGPWRNFYLTGALKLRDKLSTGGTNNKITQLAAFADMPLTDLFDYLAICISPERADPNKTIKINFIFTDAQKRFAVDYSHATLNAVSGYLYDDANVTLTLTRAQFNQLAIYALARNTKGKQKLKEFIKQHKIKIEGNLADVQTVLNAFQDFPYVKSYLSQI